MRGQTLFDSLKEHQAATPPSESSTARKGRSEELNAARNRALLDRYYYYGAYTDKRLAAILELLQDEFYLSERTILDLVQRNVLYIKGLKTNPMSLPQLKKKYPHIIW